MNTFYGTILISGIVFVIFIFFQIKYFAETRKYRNLFNNFFTRKEDYDTYSTVINGEEITQLKQVGVDGSDLNILIAEINHYVAKTKGTTDFAVIQNKVERKLNMRYDQSVAKLAFPTYLGLMGTFAGVFLGISMFIGGFNDAGDITDESIKNLLFGVLVSMSTSLIGLLLTTINNALAGESRKNIEEDKNAFYDFVQTELMPSLDVSMVLAITRLHETVDRFEPAFDGVINRFQTTFDKCTKAFGDSFEKNVTAVATAVSTMGKNMDKINENISLQQQLLSTLKSGEMVRGMDKYIEAADHFVSITKSLDKFEEARRMMLAAAQEAINLQNTYSDALKIPREVAVRVNQILDRIKTFEENVNRVGGSLDNRQILGNDVVETIREQVNAIRKKDKIALKYFEIADGKLSDVFEEQTKVLNEMNSRHKEAIAGQIAGFEEMLKEQTLEIKILHEQFIEQMQMHLNVEEIHKDFSNLRKLNEVVEQLKRLTQDPVKADELSKKLRDIQAEIAKIQITETKGGLGSIFGGGSSNSEEVRKLKGDNIRLQADIDRLQRQVTRLLTEKQNAPVAPTAPQTTKVEPEKQPEEQPAEEPKKGGWFSFGRRN
jgi:ribosomal protein S15P/S13E